MGGDLQDGAIPPFAGFRFGSFGIRDLGISSTPLYCMGVEGLDRI